jgi:hypothetical protein
MKFRTGMFIILIFVLISVIGVWVYVNSSYEYVGVEGISETTCKKWGGEIRKDLGVKSIDGCNLGEYRYGQIKKYASGVELELMED